MSLYRFVTGSEHGHGMHLANWRHVSCVFRNWSHEASLVHLSGICCCGTTTVEQSPSRTATTWPLPRTIPSGAKDAFVLLMSAAPCDFLLYGSMYKCAYLLTYFTYLW